MTIGEVYFIGERVRSTGKLTENVKIGMVGEKGTSGDRLKGHQTGNPRDLVLHHVVETPAPFWVENGLHQRLTGVRVRAEWHRLENTELEDAISLAEVLASESFAQISFIEEQERLKSSLSNGQIIDPTDESTDWHLRLSKAQVQLNYIKNLQTKFKEVIDGMSEDEIKQAEQEDLFIKEEYTVMDFDLENFSKKYPGLISDYTISKTKIGGTLAPIYLAFQISEIDPNLETFGNEFMSLCGKVLIKQAEFGDLKDLESNLQSREAVFKWEKEISTARLASICGLASGITGQLTWNRMEKTTTSLDEKTLRMDHSKEFNEFVTTRIKTRTKTRKRSRRAITEND